MQSSMFDPIRMAQRYWGMSLVRGVVAIIFGLLAIFWPHLTFSLFMLVFGVFAIVEGFILLGNSFSQHTVQASPPNMYARRADTGAAPGYTQERERTNPRDYGYGETRGQTQPQDYGYGETRGQAQPQDYGYGETRGQAQPRDYGYGGARGQEQPQASRPGAGRYLTHRANRPTLMVEGVLSILCGILALILPRTIGTLALYVIAAWALFKGIGALMQTGTRGWVLGVIGVLGILLALIVLFNPLRIIHSLIVVVGIFALVTGVMLVLRSMATNAILRRTRPLEPNY